MNYKFSSNFNNTKSKRKNATQRNIIISLGIFTASLLFDASLQFSLIVSIFFFIIQSFHSSNYYKFYITTLCITDLEIIIEYTVGNEEKRIIGDKSKFAFKKKFTLSKIRNPYLVIYFNDEKLIEQFVYGDWIEKNFDEIIGSISKYS